MGAAGGGGRGRGRKRRWLTGARPRNGRAFQAAGTAGANAGRGTCRWSRPCPSVLCQQHSNDQRGSGVPSCGRVSPASAGGEQTRLLHLCPGSRPAGRAPPSEKFTPRDGRSKLPVNRPSEANAGAPLCSRPRRQRGNRKRVRTLNRQAAGGAQRSGGQGLGQGRGERLLTGLGSPWGC